MKTLIYLLLLISVKITFAQSDYITNCNLITCNGSTEKTEEILTSKEATIIVFWETNNSRCCSNLENLQETWTEELKDYGVALIAICEDHQGNWTRIKPYVSGKGWDFEVYIDQNQTLQRSIGFTTLPYTIIIDGNNNIICSYSGYCAGDEGSICEKITQHLNKSNDLTILK